MTKRVFLSFHYKDDVRRVSQVKQIGALDEQPLLDANDWEKIEKQGDDAIKRWIAENMKDKDCNIVLNDAKAALKGAAMVISSLPDETSVQPVSFDAPETIDHFLSLISRRVESPMRRQRQDQVRP